MDWCCDSLWAFTMVRGFDLEICEGQTGHFSESFLSPWPIPGDLKQLFWNHCHHWRTFLLFDLLKASGVWVIEPHTHSHLLFHPGIQLLSYSLTYLHIPLPSSVSSSSYLPSLNDSTDLSIDSFNHPHHFIKSHLLPSFLPPSINNHPSIHYPSAQCPMHLSIHPSVRISSIHPSLSIYHPSIHLPSLRRWGAVR